VPCRSRVSGTQESALFPPPSRRKRNLSLFLFPDRSEQIDIAQFFAVLADPPPHATKMEPSNLVPLFRRIRKASLPHGPGRLWNPPFFFSNTAPQE